MLDRLVALFLALLANIAVSSSASAQQAVGCPPGGFRSAAEASDCKRTLGELERALRKYALQLATFAIDVTVSVKQYSYTSYGTALLVSLNRGWFITAKHVLLGNQVWDLNYIERPDFGDFESAIEDVFTPENPLQLPGKATIKIRPFVSPPSEALDAIVVAFDRFSDLAILQVANIDNLHNAWFAAFKPPILEPARLASGVDCKRGMAIRALGSPGNSPTRKIVPSDEGTVLDCLLTPRTVSMGGLYFRIPLYETDADFEAGMSGGPVFVEDPAEQWPYVVGIASGGVPGGDANYFVPAAAVVDFLERFGLEYPRSR
jgi:hypothetical protein